MSSNIEQKIRQSIVNAEIDREADKKIEKWLVYLSRILNKSKFEIGNYLARLIVKFSKYNLPLTILCSVAFSYIALSEDVRAATRRIVPFPIRSYFIEKYSVTEITLALAIATIVIAAWLLCSTSLSDIILKRQNKRLSKELDLLKQVHNSKSIDCTDLFSKYLYSMYRKYGYDITERISLYILELDHFRCIGRYSDNQKQTELPKKMYPKELGLIGLAWVEGKSSAENLPDPKTNMDDWIASNNELGVTISENTLRALGMKSRSLHCLRIKNSKSTSVAVIVFESTKTSLPNPIEKDFGKNESRTIANLLDALKPHMVSLEIANRAGF